MLPFIHLDLFAYPLHDLPSGGTVVGRKCCVNSRTSWSRSRLQVSKQASVLSLVPSLHIDTLNVDAPVMVDNSRDRQLNCLSQSPFFEHTHTQNNKMTVHTHITLVAGSSSSPLLVCYYRWSSSLIGRGDSYCLSLPHPSPVAPWRNMRLYETYHSVHIRTQSITNQTSMLSCILSSLSLFHLIFLVSLYLSVLFFSNSRGHISEILIKGQSINYCWTVM